MGNVRVEIKIIVNSICIFEKNASPLKRISSILVVREASSFKAWRKLSTLLLPPLSHPTFLSRSSLTQSIPTTTDRAGQWQTLSHRFFPTYFTTHLIYQHHGKSGLRRTLYELVYCHSSFFFFLNYIFQSCTTRTYRDVEMTCVKIGFQEYILLWLYYITYSFRNFFFFFLLILILIRF